MSISLQDDESIKVELLPEKKGLLRKYVEYNVASDKYKSQVRKTVPGWQHGESHLDLSTICGVNL